MYFSLVVYTSFVALTVIMSKVICFMFCYRGIGTLFGNFINSQKVSLHQLNFKTNGLVLLFKTI